MLPNWDIFLFKKQNKNAPIQTASWKMHGSPKTNFPIIMVSSMRTVSYVGQTIAGIIGNHLQTKMSHQLSSRNVDCNFNPQCCTWEKQVWCLGEYNENLEIHLFNRKYT